MTHRARRHRLSLLAGCTVALSFPPAGAHAAVQSKTIEYRVGDLTCKGHLAWDDAITGKRPGVLVVHEWWGLNDYARGRADELARLGYIAFACDMYGGGRQAEHPQDAGRMATEVRMNVEEWRRRATEALRVLTSQEQCDPQRLAAIGYCFGGSTALQLAYSGADLDAVATFHAALPVPSPEEAARIKARLQVHHGAQDSFIPEETIRQFRQALDSAKADWTMTYHGGAVHGFTVPGAEDRGMPGLHYNADADRRSWAAMLTLFEQAGLAPRQ
jgi:dienelactone hydrolase